MRGEAVLREGRAGPSCLGGISVWGESEESADCSSGTLKLTRHSCRKQEGRRVGGEALERSVQVLTWSRVCDCGGQ